MSAQLILTHSNIFCDQLRVSFCCAEATKMDLNLKHLNHGVGQNCYHLVWKPKYVLHIFKSDAYCRICKGALRQIAFNYHLHIYELQVIPDHVHLFVDLLPTMSVAKALQFFNGISSRMLRRTFSFLREYKCLWSQGKFYRSIGNVTADVIQNYIHCSQDSWSLPDNKLPA